MVGLSYTIKADEKGYVIIPYDRVLLEEHQKITNTQVKVRYIFDDYSEIIILYTPQKDYIIDRKPADIGRR